MLFGPKSSNHPLGVFEQGKDRSILILAAGTLADPLNDLQLQWCLSFKLMTDCRVQGTTAVQTGFSTGIVCVSQAYER